VVDPVSDGTRGADLKAVPRVGAPDTSRCALFERGHHAHPVQVSMALKRGADDGRFVTVKLQSADVVETASGSVARLALAPGSGDPLTLINHDPALVELLQQVQERTFVWEDEFGVLFPLTDQAREVLGTGALTLSPALESDCRTDG
jgi:hypothetical protein